MVEGLAGWREGRLTGRVCSCVYFVFVYVCMLVCLFVGGRSLSCSLFLACSPSFLPFFSLYRRSLRLLLYISMHSSVYLFSLLLLIMKIYGKIVLVLNFLLLNFSMIKVGISFLSLFNFLWQQKMGERILFPYLIDRKIFILVVISLFLPPHTDEFLSVFLTLCLSFSLLLSLLWQASREATFDEYSSGLMFVWHWKFGETRFFFPSFFFTFFLTSSGLFCHRW